MDGWTVAPRDGDDAVVADVADATAVTGFVVVRDEVLAAPNGDCG